MPIRSIDVESSAAAPAATPVRQARAVARLRLAGICVAIAVLVFSQSSGFEAADTKLDLVTAPVRFLRNALRMWDPIAGAGQMQDQAYGYLFPMGPFFVLGKLSQLPPWVVQRGWESLLVIVAFLGTVRLARLLGVRGFWPRVSAGLTYALAPRMLMELGVISSELLPVVALPWVLIPLVAGSRGGSPRRAAAASGVALLIAGGINASATLAILPVPALWLLTRTPGARRRALMAWWAPSVVLACLWWLVPLVVLGRYSPPFLDWIESSTVTTANTSLVEVLRGTDHWQAYLGPGVWPAGWTFVASGAVVLATAAVAAVALVGLCRRAVPERFFLWCCLILGLVLVTLGHVATVGPPLAATVRDLLDGPLNAFRNVHKFDPVIRLPMAIGVGYAAAAAAVWVRRHRELRPRPDVHVSARLVVGGVLVAIAAVAIAPALTGRLVPMTRTPNEPTWWRQTGQWLGRHEGLGRALVVPGAGSPVYLWGSPRDDALQPVADGPWTVRDIAPIAQPGYVRLLDAVEQSLASGVADPALPDVLSRAGIRFLIVRNDVDTTASNATPLRFVHAAIAATPQFTQVARFGPSITANDAHRLVDYGLLTANGSVEIYANTAWRDGVSLAPADGTVIANGTSDNLPALVAAGLPDSTPVIFGSEPAALHDAAIPTTPVLTDGIRRREFGFGSIGRYSAALTRDAPFESERAAHDYLPADPGVLSTLLFPGLRALTASSTASDPTSPVYLGPAYSAWSAIDAVPTTSWVSASLHGAVGQWWEAQTERPFAAATVAVAFAAEGGDSFPTRIRVTTDRGSLDQDVTPDGIVQDIRLPAGATSTLRITLLAVADGTRGSQFRIASVAVPGLLASRVLNTSGPGDPTAMVFRAVGGHRGECLTVRGHPACDDGWAMTGEEDYDITRSFTVSGGGYDLAAQVRMRTGRTLDTLLDRGNPISVRASSVDSDDPRARPGAVADGDAATGWVAAQGDRRPQVSLRWKTPATIDAIVVRRLTGAPATAPTTVRVSAGGTSFDARVPRNGRIELPRAVRTSSITVTVLRATLAASTDSVTGKAHLLPVGIGEIELVGVGVPLGSAARSVTIPCGAGIAAYVDGTAEPLQVDASTSDVLAGRAVAATPCSSSPLLLMGGAHEIGFASSIWTDPVSLTLTKTGATPFAAAPSAGRSQVEHWGAVDRSVRVDTTAPALLIVRENANNGWRATLGGRQLPSMTVDGWQQAWLVPSGAHGIVHLEFAPQTTVDIGLIVGLLGVLVLLGLMFVPARRRARLPALVEREAGFWTIAALGVLGLTALGGPLGFLFSVVALASGRYARRVVRRVPARVLIVGPAAIYAVAGLAVAIRPAGSAAPLTDNAAVQALCLFALASALGVVAWWTAAPRSGEVAQQRPFEPVPGDRGDDGGEERGERQHLDEVTAEQTPVQPTGEGDQQRQVP